MRTWEDLRRYRRLANGGKRSLVGSQGEENEPVQTAQRGWPDGRDAQKTNGQSRMWPDWAALVTNGAARYDTVIPVGALV